METTTLTADQIAQLKKDRRINLSRYEIATESGKIADANKYFMAYVAAEQALKAASALTVTPLSPASERALNLAD